MDDKDSIAPIALQAGVESDGLAAVAQVVGNDLFKVMMGKVAQELSAPGGEFLLRRWPQVSGDPLQAWDAADVNLLQHVADLALPGLANVLLLNDSHGALSTCLHHYSPVNWSDSTLSHRAATENYRINGIETPLQCLPSTVDPQGVYDLVLIRIPKTTALLEDQLVRLRPHVNSRTVIVAAAMIKYLQKSAFTCLEQLIGPVTTSLAVRKSRLLFATLDETLPITESRYPTNFTDAQTGISLFNHANVFSRDHLDHGARFLLSQYDQLPDIASAIDLGCGNGVLGIQLQKRLPDAHIRFVDESYSAVASARLNYQMTINDQHEAPATSALSTAEFVVDDGLEQCASDSTDLVLCNPPFHQQHALGDRIAQSMFIGSKRCLRQGGELWIVANRHLDYASSLQRLFGHCRTVASNRKFTVLRSVKR